jgi:hypothetical protein
MKILIGIIALFLAALVAYIVEKDRDETNPN